MKKEIDKVTAPSFFMKLRSQSPVITFFLLLFFLMIKFFGFKFVILVPVFTIMFKLNYQKNSSIPLLVKFSFCQLLISVLGYFATINIFLTLFLNLTVIFYLVYMKSSQFNPLGYYVSLMNFIFSQLILDNHSIFVKISASLFGEVIFILAIIIYNQFNSNNKIEKKIFLLISELLTDVELETINLNKLKEYMYTIYQQSYIYHEDGLRADFEVRIAYNYGLLIQRIIYYCEQTDEFEKLKNSTPHYIEELTAYLDLICSLNLNHSEDLNKGIIQGEAYLKRVKDTYENDLVISILSHTLHILKILTERNYSWKLPKKKRPFLSEFKTLKDGLEHFEFFTAVKISFLLTLCFCIVSMFNVTKAVWLPMNVFLLIHPLSEETNFRIKNRFLGTFVGCIICLLCLPWLTTPLQHVILASILGIFVYTLKPSSITQTAISTIFSLVLTTLALPITIATELRVGFILVSIIIVYFFSQLLFPFNRHFLFNRNFFRFAHIHLTFLRLIREKMAGKDDYFSFAKSQITSSLFYLKLSEYVNKHEINDLQFTELLNNSYLMLGKAEQIYIKTPIGNENQEIQHWLVDCENKLLEIQKKLKTDNLTIEEDYFQEYQVEGNETLSRLMNEYYCCILDMSKLIDENHQAIRMFNFK
ncbi:FUSC family protein [Enterococcus sp. LJL99]